jgi:hypothetical protein
MAWVDVLSDEDDASHRPATLGDRQIDARQAEQGAHVQEPDR